MFNPGHRAQTGTALRARIDPRLQRKHRDSLEAVNRLEIPKGSLDSLTRFSFGTAMLRAGYGVRSARGKVTDGNGDAYDLPVCLGRKQSQNTKASRGWRCPRLERGNGESWLLLQACQGEPHSVE